MYSKENFFKFPSKFSIVLENEVVQKLELENNVCLWSPKLTFLNERKFKKSVDF